MGFDAEIANVRLVGETIGAQKGSGRGRILWSCPFLFLIVRWASYGPALL